MYTLHWISTTNSHSKSLTHLWFGTLINLSFVCNSTSSYVVFFLELEGIDIINSTNEIIIISKAIKVF